jgi:hypothetical protein
MRKDVHINDDSGGLSMLGARTTAGSSTSTKRCSKKLAAPVFRARLGKQWQGEE